MKDLGGAMKPKVVPFVIFAYITILRLLVFFVLILFVKQ